MKKMAKTKQVNMVRNLPLGIDAIQCQKKQLKIKQQGKLKTKLK